MMMKFGWYFKILFLDVFHHIMILYFIQQQRSILFYFLIVDKIKKVLSIFVPADKNNLTRLSIKSLTLL